MVGDAGCGSTGGVADGGRPVQRIVPPGDAAAVWVALRGAIAIRVVAVRAGQREAAWVSDVLDLLAEAPQTVRTILSLRELLRPLKFVDPLPVAETIVEVACDLRARIVVRIGEVLALAHLKELATSIIGIASDVAHSIRRGYLVPHRIVATASRQSRIGLPEGRGGRRGAEQPVLVIVGVVPAVVLVPDRIAGVHEAVALGRQAPNGVVAHVHCRLGRRLRGGPHAGLRVAGTVIRVRGSVGVVRLGARVSPRRRLVRHLPGPGGRVLVLRGRDLHCPRAVPILVVAVVPPRDRRKLVVPAIRLVGGVGEVQRVGRGIVRATGGRDGRRVDALGRVHPRGAVQAIVLGQRRRPGVGADVAAEHRRRDHAREQAACAERRPGRGHVVTIGGGGAPGVGGGRAYTLGRVIRVAHRVRDTALRTRHLGREPAVAIVGVGLSRLKRGLIAGRGERDVGAGWARAVGEGRSLARGVVLIVYLPAGIVGVGQHHAAGAGARAGGPGVGDR